MEIEKINIAELKPLEKNVRLHNEVQIKELIRSLNQFGQTRAIVIDEDKNILIGNGLYFAMKERGDEQAECYIIRGLSEKQKKKLVLTDNKVYSLGRDNYEGITDFINEITMDGDFDIAGFDDEVLRQMTRDLEALEEDMKSYGIVTETDLKRPVSAPTVPQTSPQTDGAPMAAPAPQQATEHTTNEPTVSAVVKNNRTIICPSCGEVIHLD